MKLNEDLRRRLEELVGAHGLELLALEAVGNRRHPILRLVIDGPAGVSVDQCAAVSREVSAFLDVEDPISGSYTLEVSSPGVERKFYSRGDYHRFSGHRVKVRMLPSYREHRVVTGELLGLEGEVVRIMTSEGVVELPFGEVFETRLQVDWDQLMHERKCQR